MKIIYSLRSKLFLILFFCCIAGSVEAGQLHVHLQTMSDFVRFGYAVMGTVLSVNASKMIVRARIDKVWHKREEGFGYPSSRDHKPGQIVEFNIYGGVVWTDPNKSPIDMRVRGHLYIGEVTENQQVIFVPSHGYEMIAASESNIAKLDLFYSENGIKGYMEKSSAEKLYADLKDIDLSGVALDAMCERNLLDPGAFLTLEARQLFDLGWSMRDKLDDERYDSWFRSLVRSKHSPEQLKYLIDLSRETLVRDKLRSETKLELFQKLDLNDYDQAVYIKWDARETMEKHRNNPQEVSFDAIKTAIGFYLMYMEHQKFDDWQDKEGLKHLLESLTDEDKIQTIKIIGSYVMGSAYAKKSGDGYDDYLFDLFLELSEKYPSLEYLIEFEKIDLSGISKTSQSRVDNHSLLLDAAWRLEEKFPKKKKEIHSTFAKFAVEAEMFYPNLIMSIDSESPDQKRERWKRSYERFKGMAE